MKAREAGIALALIALVAAPVACGRYGEPSRTRPTAAPARSAPRTASEQAPVLAPADGSGEECPPEAQQPPESETRSERSPDEKARTP